MLGNAAPTWALPPTPPESWGVRRGLLLLGAAALAAVPLLRLRGGDAGAADVVRALTLTATALAGVGAAAALRLLRGVRDDARLGRVAVGPAALALVASMRGLTTDGSADAVAALLQWSTVPLAALAVGLAWRLRLALLAVPVAGAAVVVWLEPSGLLDGDGRTLLAALELTLAVLATAAALAWSHGSPRTDAGAHLWVTTGLALIVVTAAVRAAVYAADADRPPALLAVTALAAIVPAVGLGLWSCGPYRRQARLWRQMEAQVRGLRASSPLLPGPSITPEDEEGLPSELEVRTLLDSGLVGIALQPFVSLADGTVVGHEALARFGGRVPTDRWFRGAGLHGLSERLELLTLRTALSLLPGLPRDEMLAVNLSPLALSDDTVHATLQAADLSRVVVEITEHEAVRDYAAARAHLAQLRAAGARVAVDDTGAGFASLRHVLLLRPDIVKLDQSLTRGIDHDARQRALVVALTRFAAEVGVGLVAEGVETSEQASALRELGLAVGQGWGLGVPVLQRTDAAGP